MLLKGVSWSGVVACAIFYCVIFIAVRYPFSLEIRPLRHEQLGMLLFVLPGALSAFTSRYAPLTVAALGPLLATPVCLLLMVMNVLLFRSFWQEWAFSISAIFWCCLGALSVMLTRTLIEMRQSEG